MLKLLRFIFFLVIPCSFWAQGEDCGTATPINNVQNYCSGNGVFTNVGSTPGTYGLPTCWPANATEDVWFSFVPGEFSSPSELVSFNNGTQGASSYVWLYGDGNSSNQPEGTHTYTNTTGGYFVTLIASSPSGCSDSLTQFIGYQEPLIYYVPNTFTPDQDQFNQQWKPIFTSGFDPYDYHLRIFNRWGELIWESFNDETGWDGVYGKDFQAQEGIYT
jgi:gliding motility-associated-like protein